MKIPTVQIGDLASNDRGAFKIGPFGSALKKSELVASGIPVAGIENVLPNKFVKGFRRFISPTKFRELSDYEILPEDVLVTTMGTIGRAAITPREIGCAIFDSHLFRMRIDTKRTIPAYLCYAINGDSVVWQLQQMARGAIMDGLNTTILKSCLIPLPDLVRQRQVVAMLEQANRLRRTRRYALELGETLLLAAFRETFGLPWENQGKFPVERFVEIGTLDRGRSQHRPRNAPHLYGGSYPFVQTGDVANSEGYIRRYTQTYSEAGLAQSKLWKKGTLCITIAANIADTGVLDFEACFPDSIVGFTPGPRVTVEYVQYWLNFTQTYLQRIAPESAQKNINLEILGNLRLAVPPLPLQQRFATLVARHECLRARHRESLRQADHLFQTLLHRAFIDV